MSYRYFGETSYVPVSTNSVSVPEGAAGTTGTNARNDSALTSIVDIFGRVVDRYGNTPPPATAAPSQTPLWVWIALPVGGLVLLGVASRLLRRKKK